MTFSQQRKSAQQAAETSTRAVSSETEASFEVLFEEIFEAHWIRVCSLIYRVVGDWAEAEDLALDTFWRLYHQPPKSEQNLNGWLYRVASNLGFNALRARKRRQRYEEEAGKAALERSSLDASNIVEETQQRELVRRVLASMKPRSAQVLILRHSGLSYNEVAAALHVSTGSVGTLIARAEKEFEQRYQNALPER